MSHHHEAKHHFPHSFHELIHPHNGKKIHIVQSPTHARELRSSLAAQGHETQDIDVYLHGSEEHIELLQRMRDHHDEQCELIKEKHGDIYHEIENVLIASANLSKELEHAQNQGVDLQMNFDKFGYGAHLRAHNASHNASGTQSSASSVSDKGKSSKEDWIAQRIQGRSMSLFVKPILRQYFHKGLLWRAQEPEETASYELFLDLIYVGIVAISGDSAAQDPNGKSLLRFIITFIMGWNIWFDVGNIIGWFDADDIIRRFYVAFILTCLLGFTTDMTEYYHDTYTPLVCFYLTARYALIAYQLLAAYLIPNVRSFLYCNSTVKFLPTISWIVSIHVQEPRRQIAIWIAIVSEVILPHMIPFFVVVFQKRLSSGGWLNRKFEYVPAINIEHRTERMASFVILVVGYSVVSSLYQNQSRIGLNSFFGKAVLGLTQAFSFSSLYYEMDSFNLHTHAIRRHAITAFTWHMSHLPMILGFILAGAVLSRLVLTADVSAGIDTLAPDSAAQVETEIPDALRWFYCVGLGIALLSTCCIAFGHVFRTPPRKSRCDKYKRLCYRVLVSLCIIFLGFAKSLNSLQLIATTNGLVFSALAAELLGNTLSGLCRGAEKRECKYMIKRRDMRKSVSSMGSEKTQVGEEIEEEVHKGNVTESVEVIK